MKRIGLIVLAVAAIVVVAAFILRNGDDEVGPVYRLVPISTRDIVVSASAAGVVEPITTVEVKSKASGEIFEMRVETGDHVTADELLVRVDPRVPQAQLRQARADLVLAEAQLENAQAKLRRSEELHRTQSITEQEYEDSRLAVASAQAQLVRAERSLADAEIAAEDTEVKAPISGVIIVKNVEVGSVISSATAQVGGGTVLMQMANLDTVQVRALVDETDIGKIQPGMAVTITVDAYQNRPFQGRVLKIEPLATVTQNVTMFPVLVRIPNTAGLLKPGMNSEVEVHVGDRQGVLAVPNTALRTDRDVGSAAEVLGLDPEAVQEQIAAARRPARGRGSGAASEEGAAAQESAGGETVTWRGREIPLPEGVDAEAVRALSAKLEGASDMRSAFQSLTDEERALMQQLRAAGGRGRGGFGGQGGPGARGQGPSATDAALIGGSYIVFAMRNGVPTPVPVRTGLTDLDYSEVLSGLSEGDTVLVLPSASLLASQQEWQERAARRAGGVPGVQTR
ncbi:MAG: efflux RND transporter periplasmic adaptor subunit [Gemmatimonadota bacterium]|nr:MAG: efflux RND transporter periplasmic adaptor subunit [Gemmatimonadota bacterium]